MAARKIDGWWYVDFHVHKIRYRKRSPKNSRAGAIEYEEFLRGELAKMGSLTHLDPPKEEKSKQVLTFAEFAERWMRDYVAANNKPSEQRTKAYVLRIHLLPAFGRFLLPEITVVEIERFKAEVLARGLKAKSINNFLCILHKCLVTAVEWGEIATVPRIRMLRTTLPSFRFLSTAESEKLIATAAPGVWRTMIRTALRTGLRFSELAGLEWQDVDLDRGFLCVRRAVVHGHVGSTKSNRVRYVGLTSDLSTELRGMQRRSGPVFLHEGERVNYDVAVGCLERTCRCAKIPIARWHVLRHTFASELAQRGASLQAIQQLLGHSTVLMTQRYAHLTPDVLRRAVALLEPKSPDAWAAGGQEHASKPDLGSSTLPPNGEILAPCRAETPPMGGALAW